MFKNTIVRRPGKSITDGLTTASLGKPVYDLALQQHEQYIKIMASTGVQVKILPADEAYPDGCFVEDPALLTENVAIITNPGAPSRKDETAAIKKALEEFYDRFEHIEEPGTLEGGDVMRIANHFYIGLSTRTNEAGAGQLINILEKHGYTGSIIRLQEMFHLKTGVNYIEDNTLLVAGEFITHPGFNQFDKIIIDKDEMYAANCIRMNDYLIIPAGYPKTKETLLKRDFRIKEVEMSEFQKIDGGLTCLSLRF